MATIRSFTGIPRNKRKSFCPLISPALAAGCPEILRFDPPGNTVGGTKRDLRNAGRYHVWLFIVGVDTGYRNVDTVTDTNSTLTNLPSGKTAKIQITAVNAAGESGRQSKNL